MTKKRKEKKMKNEYNCNKNVLCLTKFERMVEKDIKKKKKKTERMRTRENYDI